MFSKVIAEWRAAAPESLVEDSGHHEQSAHAAQTSKDVEAHDKLASELHYDPSLSPLEKHDRAVETAGRHGTAEIEHLKAAKSQFRKGNEDLASHHEKAAKHHRDQRVAWMGGAHAAHLSHRENEFAGHYPARALHKEKWNKEHPYDFEKWARKEAETFAGHADRIPPHSPRHRDSHEKAAKYWGAASQAAREAADATGPGTEDHSYYSMRAHHADQHHLHHKTKASI